MTLGSCSYEAEPQPMPPCVIELGPLAQISIFILFLEKNPHHPQSVYATLISISRCIQSLNIDENCSQKNIFEAVSSCEMSILTIKKNRRKTT